MVHRKAYSINICLNLDNKIGTAKFRAAGMINSIEGGYTETMKKWANSELPNAPSVAVFSISLDFILTAVEMYRINFVSLDVEGAELAILNAFPFDIVKIDLLFI